ncbi:MAG: MEKHLA domain-containing protein, partial [cyanobacterium BACL30 MAG-120619-bin27]
AADASPLLVTQELFAAELVLLAHDGADPSSDPGPRLIYANRAALRLWQRPWAELVGMPSRLTAEPAERASRRQALLAAQAKEAIAGYSGIRIDSRGRRFAIEAARLWTLRDSSGQPCGQAARFSRWHWL